MRTLLFFPFLLGALPAQNPSQVPVIATGGVLNAASSVANLAPGAIGTLYGSQLADGIPTIAFTDSFPSQVGGTTISVNGVNAPLIYVSPTQVNFQIPWETPVGASVPIIVTRDTTASTPASVSIAAAEAPSTFLNDPANGIAWVTGAQCVATECAIKAGAVYQLWANGLGPKNAPSQDGVPAVYSGSLSPLEVPDSPAS